MLQEILKQINGLNGMLILKAIGVPIGIFAAFILLRKIFTNYIFKKLLQLTKKTKTDIDEKLLIAFESPLRAFFVIIGIFASLLYLPLTEAQNLLLLKFFRSSIVILLAWGLYNIEGSYSILFEEIGKRWHINIDKILIPFFSKILRFVTVVLTISIVAQEWGYDVDGFVTGLGLGGLAFALAAKDTIANIFGGIVIIMDKPFSMGDWISTPNIEGVVEDVSFRSTKIRTFAQAVVAVPNSTLANEPITNWSKMGKRRITFNLGVEYGTSTDNLKNCINEIKHMLEHHPEIHKETIFVRFNKFNESSLDIFLYFFTNTTYWEEFLKVKEDVNFRIMEILENEGVNVAFPSRSIYVETPLKFTEAKAEK